MRRAALAILGLLTLSGCKVIMVQSQGDADVIDDTAPLLGTEERDTTKAIGSEIVDPKVDGDEPKR